MPFVLRPDMDSRTVSDSPPQDARALQRELAETFSQPLSEPLAHDEAMALAELLASLPPPAPLAPKAPPPRSPPPKPAQFKLSAAHVLRIVKIGLGLGLLFVFGAKPAWRLLAPCSSAAVFARPIALRAPIDGVATVQDKDAIIVNTRADSGAVESLAREAARLNADIASAEARRAGVEAAFMEETATAQAFHTTARNS
jgi:hypothetical protein